MIAKKKSPRPQLLRWCSQFEAAWRKYRDVDYPAWKNSYADERGREPSAPRLDEMVLQPLARFLNKHCFGGKAETSVYGPQGICSRYTLDFEYRGRTYYLGVEPQFQDDAPLLVLRRFDLKPKGNYSRGSIGEANCLNYPTTRVTRAEPAEWWRKRMTIEPLD